jgi:hypothetical protein
MRERMRPRQNVSGPLCCAAEGLNPRTPVSRATSPVAVGAGIVCSSGDQNSAASISISAVAPERAWSIIALLSG